MSITITLSDETEAALRAEAENQNRPAEAIVAEMVASQYRHDTWETEAAASDGDVLENVASGAEQFRQNHVLSLSEADAGFDALYHAARERVRATLANGPLLGANVK